MLSKNVASKHKTFFTRTAGALSCNPKYITTTNVHVLGTEYEKNKHINIHLNSLYILYNHFLF